MATNETLIPIPGRLHSVASEGHVSGADEIYDDTLGKDQATINSEVSEALGEGGTVDEKIAAAIEDVAYIDDTESSSAIAPSFDPESQTVHVTAQTLSENQKAQVRTNIGLGDVDSRISTAVASEATLRASAISAEQSRAQAAEGALQSNIEALSQSDIVVVVDHTAVSSPTANTIYREQGTTSYSDWMYYDGEWKQMATYNNAIDDEPTAGSDNLVKSGGVYDQIEQLEMEFKIPNGIIPQKVRLGYAIWSSDGSVIDNTASAICGGIPINKGDVLIFNTFEQFYPNVALLGFSTTLNNEATSYEVLPIENIGTNLYKYKATQDGYIYIGCKRWDYNPTATIYKNPTASESYSKQVECIWGTTGYIDVDGSSSAYRIGGVSVISPSINVLAGDIIDVTILGGINEVAVPIAFNDTDPEVSNSSPAGHYVPLCQYVAQQTEYHAVAPSDGYIFITFDPSNTTYVTITRNRTRPDITPIWEGKKWLCIGDSLTNDNKTAKLRYLDYIANETGILPINVGISGSGYKRLQDDGLAFYQQAQKHYVNGIEVVTIFGSFNDTNYSAMGYNSLDEYIGVHTDLNTETIAGCINTLIANIIAVNPLARIGIIAPCPWEQTRYVDGSDVNKYVNMLELVAKYNSVPFLNLFTDSGLMPWISSVRSAAYTRDSGGGVHPDENGQKMLSAKIKAFMSRLLLNE